MSNLFEYLAIPTEPPAPAPECAAGRGDRRAGDPLRARRLPLSRTPRSGRSRTSTSSSPRGRAWRWWGRTARARRRSSSCWRACTSRPRGGCCWTGAICATGTRPRCAQRIGVIFQDFNQYQFAAARERRGRQRRAPRGRPAGRARGRAGRGARAGGDAGERARDAARALVQGRGRAVGRAVAEGGAGPRLHARGGGHPHPRRADGGAGRRGRARGVRAFPGAGRRAAPPSSSRTAFRPCAWPIASWCWSTGA